MFSEEVFQTTATSTTLDQIETGFYYPETDIRTHAIYQAGSYMTEEYENSYLFSRPFYSPLLSTYSDAESCSFTNFGQNAFQYFNRDHPDNPAQFFGSNILYSTNIHNIGEVKLLSFNSYT